MLYRNTNHDILFDNFTSIYINLFFLLLGIILVSFLGDLPNPGIKPGSPTLQADSLPFEQSGKPVNIFTGIIICI